MFLYRTATDKCEPMYYTLGDSLSDAPIMVSAQSAVETKDGLFYIRMKKDEGEISRYELYRIPHNKKANTAVIKGGSASVKFSAARKKAVTKKVVKVSKAKGSVTYTIAGGSKKSKQALSLNKKNGKITVRRGTKRGKYTLKVKVTVKGNSSYKPKTKTVKAVITVK